MDMEHKGIRNAKQMRETSDEAVKMKKAREVSDLIDENIENLSIINELVFREALQGESSVSIRVGDLKNIKSAKDLDQIKKCLEYRGYGCTFVDSDNWMHCYANKAVALYVQW